VHYFLRVGNDAPEFTAVADTGKKWSDVPFLGKRIVVLFFYEADFTPNCTREAREMQAVFTALRGERAELVGVSGDSPETHQRFKKSNKLTYPLLSDPKGELAKRFGVSQSGGGVLRIKDRGEHLDIRRTFTAGRWTYIIDRDGKIAYKKPDVNPIGHAKEVLTFVRRLNANDKR
jgi:peroxiredoxin Q/BCP